MRDSIQIIPSKHRYSVSFLPLYCMFYITFISVLIHSLILTLRHLILITFYSLTGTMSPFGFISLKLLTSLRTNHTKVCSLMKNSVSYGVKKIRLNPSIDPFIIFSDSLWYARGINIEVLLYICVSTFLRVIHLNIYTISTIRDIF